MKKYFPRFFLFLFFFLVFLGAHRLIEVRPFTEAVPAKEEIRAQTPVLIRENTPTVKEEATLKGERGLLNEEKLKSRQQQQAIAQGGLGLLRGEIPYYKAVYYAFTLGDKAG